VRVPWSIMFNMGLVITCPPPPFQPH